MQKIFYLGFFIHHKIHQQAISDPYNKRRLISPRKLDKDKKQPSVSKTPDLHESQTHQRCDSGTALKSAPTLSRMTSPVQKNKWVFYIQDCEQRELLWLHCVMCFVKEHISITAIDANIDLARVGTHWNGLWCRRECSPGCCCCCRNTKQFPSRSAHGINKSHSWLLCKGK